MHTVFAGITRIGKSETVKTAVNRSKDTRFLILDVKRPRDYPDIGVEVPIFIEEKTEPLMLKRLLESQSHLALKFEFPELLKVFKKSGTRTYPDILRIVNEMLEGKMHPIRKDKLLVLQHLLTRLVAELDGTPIADRLQMKGRINVMDLSNVSQEMQQLAMHSVLKKLLMEHRNIVVVADEFHRFAPQYGSNPSKDATLTYIKEGAAKDLYLWVVDQTITGVDKDVLKQCWVWVLGKQRELNEAKRTLDQIPFKTGLNDKAVMRLKRGHFVVCTEDFAKLSYIWLSDVPRKMAETVSLGKLPVKKVIEYLNKIREKKEEDVDLKELEQLKRTQEMLIDTVESLKEVVEAHIENDVITPDLKDLREKVENLQDTMLKKLEKGPFPLDYDMIEELWKGEIQVTKKQPKLVVTRKVEPLHLSQDDITGRIAIVYAEGLLPKGKAFSTRKLNKIMTERFGRKEAYPNFKKVLRKFVSWGYFEKVQAGRRWDHKVKLPPEKAKEKGLLEIKG